MFRFRHISLLILLLYFFYGCGISKKIPEGNYLLVKNKIEIKSNIDQKEKIREELKLIVKQKPNRRIFGFIPFHLGAYNLGFKKIGEPPVLLEVPLTSISKNQITLYMQGKGYFHSTVEDTILYHGKRKNKATVIYTVNPDTVYTLRNFTVESNDTLLLDFIKHTADSGLIVKGEHYDEEIFDLERKRIVNVLRNRGYYFVNKNYFGFEADTSIGNHQADLIMKFRGFDEFNNPEVKYAPQNVFHLKYKIRKVFVQTAYDPRNQSNFDSTGFVFSDSIYFDSDYRCPVKWNTLKRSVFINSGKYFRENDVIATYNHLNDLNIFRFITIRFLEAKPDSINSEHYVDAVVQLALTKRQDYTLEGEATNNGGNLGVAGSFGFRNKNIFCGAEAFEVKLHGSVESLKNSTTDNTSGKLPLAIEFGPELSLDFKKLLLIDKWFTPSTIRKTKLSFGVSYEDRPDLYRTAFNFTFGWNLRWKQNRRLYFSPFEFNSVNVNLSPELKQLLEQNASAASLYSYTNHVIPSFAHLTYSSSNQATRKNFTFFRINYEAAGLIPYAASKWTKAEKNIDDKYTIGGIQFNQYVKPDVDISYHHFINPNNSIVFRAAGGIGFSYLNSKDDVLPFDRAFYGGGANGIRAWQARSLGPGSYNTNLSFESIGDVKLESNIEYRSSIIDQLELAAFLDAGNIWRRKDAENLQPGSVFNSKRFLDEVAIGGGLGMRINFTFFIMRFDFAVKLRNPLLTTPGHWVYPNEGFQLGDIVTNLAIGYPF